MFVKLQFYICTATLVFQFQLIVLIMSMPSDGVSASVGESVKCTENNDCGKEQGCVIL